MRAHTQKQKPAAGKMLPPKARTSKTFDPTAQASSLETRFEFEADRVADQILRSPGTGQVRPSFDAQRLEGPNATESPAPNRGSTARVDGLRGQSQALDASTRGFMEPRFRHSFADVRIHADDQAAEAARKLGARAFTVGRHIGFGAGEYLPQMTEGRRLVAHELTHVLQQTAGVSTANDAVGIRTTNAPLVVARKEKKYGSAVTARPIQVPTSAGDFFILPAGSPVGYTEDIPGVSYTIYYHTGYYQRSSSSGASAYHTSQIHRSWLTGLTEEQAPTLQWDQKLKRDEEPVSLESFGHEFLTWNPRDEAKKADEAAAAKAERSAGVHAASQRDIAKEWGARSEDFLEVATDPDNKLSGRQMYQIWVTYWVREQYAAHAAMDEIEAKLRAELGAGEFSAREYDFYKLGKRHIYGAEYERAANRKAAVDFVLLRVMEVRNWLLEHIDLLGNHPTLEEVNLKAHEIVKAYQNYQTYFAPFIYGAIAVGGIPRTPRGSSQKAPASKVDKPASGTRADEPVRAPKETKPPGTLSGSATGKIKPLNGKINVGGGLETGSKTATNLNPVKPHSGGPSRGIPNHVKAGFENIADVFEAGSATRIFSNRLRYVDVKIGGSNEAGWTQAANGSAKVLAPGGKLVINVWTTSAAETQVLVDAFRAAGFKNIRSIGSGSGTTIIGTR